jgi:hypothetical protein
LIENMNPNWNNLYDDILWPWLRSPHLRSVQAPRRRDISP